MLDARVISTHGILLSRRSALSEEGFHFLVGKFKKSCTSTRQRKKECTQRERVRRREGRKRRGAERIARRDCGGGVESTSVKHGTRLTRGSKSCRGRGTRHKSAHRFLLFYFRVRENFCLLVAVASGGKMDASFATHGRLEERCGRGKEKVVGVENATRSLSRLL